MRAAVLDHEGTFRVEDRPDPVPGRDDVVVRVTGCGICASDLSARAVMPPGTVMGHEMSGEIVALGADVAGSWRVGDRAAVLPVFSCGTCRMCRSGHVAHCDSVQMIGLGGSPGGYSEFVRSSAALTIPLPPSIPEAHGALVEPFTVGLHAVNVGAVGPDDTVLVLGAGPVGLATTAWARHLGARSVTVSDPSPSRREAAGVMGATAVLDPTRDDLGGPYDVVIECVGRPGLLDAATGAARTLGRIVVAGVCGEPDTFMPLTALLKELTIRYAIYYRLEEFRLTVDAFAAGTIDPSAMISRTIDLDSTQDAFDTLQSSTDDLKVVIDPRIRRPR